MKNNMNIQDSSQVIVPSYSSVKVVGTLIFQRENSLRKFSTNSKKEKEETCNTPIVPFIYKPI